MKNEKLKTLTDMIGLWQKELEGVQTNIRLNGVLIKVDSLKMVRICREIKEELERYHDTTN